MKRRCLYYMVSLGALLFFNSCLLFEYVYDKSTYYNVFLLYPAKDGKSYDKVNPYTTKFNKRCKELVVEKGLSKGGNDWKKECKCDCYMDYSDNYKIKIMNRDTMVSELIMRTELIEDHKVIFIPTLILPFITIHKLGKGKFYWNIMIRQQHTNPIKQIDTINPIKQIDTIILHFYKYNIIDTIIPPRDVEVEERHYIDTLHWFEYDTITTKKGTYCRPYRTVYEVIKVYWSRYSLTKPSLIYLPVNRRVDTLLYFGMKIIYRNNEGEEKHLSIDSLDIELGIDKGFRRTFL